MQAADREKLASFFFVYVRQLLQALGAMDDDALNPIFLHLYICIVLGCVLNGCASYDHPVSTYSYSGQVIASNSQFAIELVADHRRNEPNFLGAIRGGFGNVLKTIETDEPVIDFVHDTFREALVQRNIYATEVNTTHRIFVDLLKFDCNKMSRQEAHVKFLAKVIDARDGKVVLSEEIDLKNVSGPLITAFFQKPFTSGVLASENELRDLAYKTLYQAIDQLIEMPSFSALHGTESVGAEQNGT